MSDDVHDVLPRVMTIEHSTRQFGVVFHIVSESKTEPATMTDFAHVADGVITYPASPDEVVPGT